MEFLFARSVYSAHALFFSLDFMNFKGLRVFNHVYLCDCVHAPSLFSLDSKLTAKADFVQGFYLVCLGSLC